MKLRVIPGRSREWTDHQKQTILDGIESTNGTVPSIQGDWEAFIVVRGEYPIGMLTVWPGQDGNSVEVGARFWVFHPSIARVLRDGLRDLFGRYEFVIARCYANNMRVRRLLQRAAFILLSIQKEEGRTVHVYGCRKPDFLRVVS